MLDYNLLGSRIRALRQQKGLTQSAFAQGLGVSFQAVSNWERGVTPPDLENLVGIASFFGVLVDDLLRQNNAPLYLGIDGGGTKTEFTVVTADGFVHKRVITTGCNPNDIGFHPMWELLSQNIEALLVELPSIKAAFCGIAGITTGNNTAKLQSSLQNRFPQVDFQVKSDAFNLLNMDDRADMALISGTGSVVFVRKGEDYARLGGWGYLLDSAGSAYDIGRSAVQAALAEEDGLLPASLLRKKLLEKLQTNTIWQGLNQIYSGGKP
ncbi:MAG: XRE family transcriptional regulator, partial [Oscillospiraceae bacterium]|nr:XRE family transcriptional regulator [Oscillospiraceae bacterium]